MFKHKSWFQRNRTGIGAGVQLISIFLLKIVVVIISTIGNSINTFTSIDDIDRERAKTWRAYKEGRYLE
jgi:hypothetical protein